MSEQYEKLDYRCASIYVRLSTTQGGNNVYFLRNLGSVEGDTHGCAAVAGQNPNVKSTSRLRTGYN